jgi:methionyl-tRNA formyltransferase
MNKKIKIIFMGTAGIGAPLLKALSQDARFEIPLVVTQKDMPAGRKMELQPSPIKVAAQSLGLSVFQPENINTPESLEALKLLGADFFIVMAYGQILKKEVFTMPRACLNVHVSLLPKYRGASPVQHAILAGEDETGISLMQIEEGLDTGPVFARATLKIESQDNTETVSHKLALLSAGKVPDLLMEIHSGALKSVSQNNEDATYCHKIEKSEGEIHWKDSAQDLERKVRGLYGWPSAYTKWNGKLLKIHQARAHEGKSEAPGKIYKEGSSIFVGTGRGALELLDVQLEGKKAMPIAEFVKGNGAFVGSVLS